MSPPSPFGDRNTLVKATYAARRLIVSFADCYRDLVFHGGPSCRSTYREWEARPGYGEVVDFVKQFNHEHLFDITPERIDAIIATTEHALGDVAASEQIAEIEDFTCPFAFEHLFHRYIERTKRIPTWQQFWRWMARQARPYFLDRLEPLRRQLRQSYTDERIDNAVRWRLGKFYYSALREVDLLAALHARGVPLKYHVLADVLLRVDYWMGQTLVCIYFPNQAYRSGHFGRKPKAGELFSGSRPRFEIVDFHVRRQGYGRFWRISGDSKEELANLLA